VKRSKQLAGKGFFLVARLLPRTTLGEKGTDIVKARQRPVQETRVRKPEGDPE
jgi:hypothetical protein